MCNYELAGIVGFIPQRRRNKNSAKEKREEKKQKLSNEASIT